MDNKYKIIVDNVSKSYKMYNTLTDHFKEALSLSKKTYHSEFYALSNVSFSVKEGEILGIMGRNGAGKSTLLKIITGVLNPTYGSVTVSGRISSLLELGAGFNPEYTGVENIYFYSTLMGLSKLEIDNKLNDIIDFAEIGDYVYQPVKTYSSGMFARLAFSCAINVEPDVLIVDEILSVGDIRFQSKCFKKFKEFKNRGVTILYVGHDISTMRTFCDACLWLNNGKMVDLGEPTYISAKYTEFMYLDDISSFTDYKMINNSTKMDEVDEKASNTNQQKIAEDLIKDEDIVECKNINMDEAINDKRVLAHWGSKTGSLYNARMFIDGNKDIISCSPYDKITVAISVKYDKDIDYENSSVAFSIKNKEGIDLIVKTTWDDDIRFFGMKKDFTVKFEFESRLTSGDYYFVVALENRKEATISYYEYVEGIKYFKIFENKGLYGQFLPNIKTNIYVNEDTI